MADEAHLRTLKKGVEAWNKWRAKNRLIQPDLDGGDFRGADFYGVDFRGLDLSRADLSGANLNNANLCVTNLERAVLRGASLDGTALTESNLTNANLCLTSLTHANLSGADLSETNLNGADLRKANLSGASLNRATLRESYLQGANLSFVEGNEADFTNCLMGETTLGAVDFSRCKGLDTVTHASPSTIGIDTIYRSGGNIPEVFLRGAGVPEPFIIHMKSLVAAMSPIEFYSCFISYSSKDQEFAERLYADLQSRRVRCWFAPEDLKIGDKLRPAFDEAIRVHDKLMVLLSENSVGSPWVEKEVETAFEKERQQNRTVLFPIRLDEAVMATDQAWAADIRRTRHIGDFRDWKNHDSYKKAFDRLLRDLKAV